MEDMYGLLVIFMVITNEKKHPQEENIYMHVFCYNQVAKAVESLMGKS